MNAPDIVTIIKCSCGHPSCRDYWLSNGSFCQGSGFDKEEAERVALACNSHEALVAALTRSMKALREACGGIFDDAANADTEARAALKQAETV